MFCLVIRWIGFWEHHFWLVFIRYLLIWSHKRWFPNRTICLFFQCICCFLTCIADAVCHSGGHSQVSIYLAFCLRRVSKSRLGEEFRTATIAPKMLILLETSIQMQNFVIIDWLLYFAFLLQTSYKILCLLCSQTRSDKLQKHCFSWEVYWFSIIYQHFPLWIFSLLALAPPGLNFQIWPPLRNLSFS